MAKQRPLTPKQDARRLSILTAARDLMGDQGYDGMVMSQVAERAGVSPTTLYNHYNTKDELILEALRELMIDNTKRVFEASEGPGRQHLLLYFRNGPDMASAEPSFSEAITHTFLGARNGDALVEVLLTNPRRDILDSLKAMAREGELRADTDIEELATALIGVYWSSFILREKGLIDVRNLTRSVLLNALPILITFSQGEAQRQLTEELENVVRSGNTTA